MRNKRASRAQIFQSFDALKGFRELLLQQEKVIVDKKILSEDDLNELDYKVRQIQVGKLISIIYFDGNDYIKLEGKVSKLNFDTKTIQLVKTKLDLKSIIEINILD